MALTYRQLLKPWNKSCCTSFSSLFLSLGNVIFSCEHAILFVCPCVRPSIRDDGNFSVPFFDSAPASSSFLLVVPAMAVSRKSPPLEDPLPLLPLLLLVNALAGRTLAATSPSSGMSVNVSAVAILDTGRYGLSMMSSTWTWRIRRKRRTCRVCQFF